MQQEIREADWRFLRGLSYAIEQINTKMTLNKVLTLSSHATKNLTEQEKIAFNCDKHRTPLWTLSAKLFLGRRSRGLRIMQFSINPYIT